MVPTRWDGGPCACGPCLLVEDFPLAVQLDRHPACPRSKRAHVGQQLAGRETSVVGKTAAGASQNWSVGPRTVPRDVPAAVLRGGLGLGGPAAVRRRQGGAGLAAQRRELPEPGRACPNSPR